MLQDLIRTRPPERRAASAALGLLIGAFAAATGHAADCAAGWAEAAPSGVTDARTLLLRDERTMRLAGIEPFSLLRPELSEAEPALERRLRTLLETAPMRVHLATEQPDRYGRLPALVAGKDDTLVQEILAREGLAIAFATGDPIPCFDKILAAEEEARRGRRGFWAGATLPEPRPQALAPFIGRFAIFEGVVISVGNRPSRTYLNFGGWWAEDVTVEIAGQDRDRLGGEAGLAELAGKRVRVRGFVEEKQGPTVIVRSPMQIETVGPEIGAREEAP